MIVATVKFSPSITNLSPVDISSTLTRYGPSSFTRAKSSACLSLSFSTFSCSATLRADCNARPISAHSSLEESSLITPSLKRALAAWSGRFENSPPKMYLLKTGFLDSGLSSQLLPFSAIYSAPYFFHAAVFDMTPPALYNAFPIRESRNSSTWRGSARPTRDFFLGAGFLALGSSAAINPFAQSIIFWASATSGADMPPLISPLCSLTRLVA